MWLRLHFLRRSRLKFGARANGRHINSESVEALAQPKPEPLVSRIKENGTRETGGTVGGSKLP